MKSNKPHIADLFIGLWVSVMIISVVAAPTIWLLRWWWRLWV